MTLFDDPIPSPRTVLDYAPARWHPGLPYVRLVVRGTPVPQGDLSVGKRGKLYHSNDAELKPWRAHVAGVGTRAMVLPAGGLRPPLDGPLAVRLVFSLTRPVSVKRRDPTTRPDVDKLTRAVCDALTQGDGSKARRGALWVDDARVVDVHSRKVYAACGDVEALPFPGVTVHVWQLADA